MMQKQYLLNKQYSNIGIVIPGDLNDTIDSMVRLQKNPKVGNEPHGRPFGINKKKIVMNIFRYDHIKNSIISE